MAVNVVRVATRIRAGDFLYFDEDMQVFPHCPQEYPTIEASEQASELNRKVQELIARHPNEVDQWLHEQEAARIRDLG